MVDLKALQKLSTQNHFGDNLDIKDLKIQRIELQIHH
jgi:hypothetical protein